MSPRNFRNFKKMLKQEKSWESWWGYREWMRRLCVVLIMVFCLCLRLCQIICINMPNIQNTVLPYIEPAHHFDIVIYLQTSNKPNIFEFRSFSRHSIIVLWISGKTMYLFNEIKKKKANGIKNFNSNLRILIISSWRLLSLTFDRCVLFTISLLFFIVLT